MDFFFQGHDYRYAAEQMLLMLLPGERPRYPLSISESGEDWAKISLQSGEVHCELCLYGRYARTSVAVEAFFGELEKHRNEQRAVKTAFYRAALAVGVKKPVWGSLTGVKPGKLMARYLKEGKTAADFAADYDVSAEKAMLCEQTARQSIAAKKSLAEEDICLYVGIPFCPTRCAYCSFVSNSVEKSTALVEPYLAALRLEIQREALLLKEKKRRIVALYIGGGTPTTLSATQLDDLCGCLSDCFDLSSLREYTVEAGRPDTITVEKLKTLRRHGVDRVSVNPQSMSDEVLRAIGRRHTASDVLRGVELVREVGGFALNMDLIAGLPRDNPDSFSRTLDILLPLRAENLTVHTLSLKNGSRLSENPQALPSPTEVSHMLAEVNTRFVTAGYRPYYLYRQKYMSGGFENVGWTKEGFVNLYNICMMEELCPVLALGAGASGKIPKPDGSIERRVNPKYPKEYIERIKSRE